MKYEILTTDEQDAALQATVNGINAARADETPSREPLDATAYLQAILDLHLNEWTKQQDRQSFDAAWTKASAAEKAAFVAAIDAKTAASAKAVRRP